MRQSVNNGARLLEGLWEGPWRSNQPDQFLSVPGELPEFPGLGPPEEIHAMWTEFPRKRWQERWMFYFTAMLWQNSHPRWLFLILPP